MKHFKLGASIYVPANRSDLITIAKGNKIKAKSVIFCTEDSILESELPLALDNIKALLLEVKRTDNMLKFIRVRNENVLATILSFEGVENIDGFVFPKITAENFNIYMSKFQGNFIYDIMPTLETKEVFSVIKMEELVHVFEPFKNNILSLRIGGNDLLNLLSIRRSKHRTIYETPVGMTISHLVAIFKPHGYNLTSPVCEFLYDNEIIMRELPLDLEHGLFGKTAIHPDQISTIEQFYKVSEEDFEMATHILDPQAKAVFNMHGTMCEVATHSNWAKEILERATIYGVFGQNS